MRKIVLMVVSFLVIGGFLGVQFAAFQKNQPRVAPNSSAGPVIGQFNQLTPAPTQQTVGSPTRLIISKIGVNAPVEQVGLDKLNRMDVPKKADDVGWYSLGVRPGEAGNAVVDGHLDRNDLSPAVFWNLKKMQVGDQLQIQDDRGQTLNFKVTDVESYPWNSFPIQQVFGATSKKMLNLITCQGTFDVKSQLYSDREVVFTQLIE